MPAAVSAMVRDRLPDAWRAVADALGVPAGQRAYPRVILLGSRDLYRRRLVEGGTPLAAAERIASGAAGSTDGDRIFVVADAEVVDILGTLAHELGHVALHRLGLAETMPQWLQEGLVEYVARSVVEGQRWTPAGSRYWAVIHKEVLDLAAAGKLEDLFDDNADFIGRLGDYPAHSQAMVAVTLLWDRWGDQAVAAYFNALKAGTPHRQVFQNAFNISVEEFQRVFRNHLAQRSRVDYGRVRVVLELPQALRGSLTVFAPGRRRAASWELSTAGEVTVRYDPGQAVTVSGAVRGDAGWEWALEKTPEHLIVYIIPDEPLQVGDLWVKQVGVIFDAFYGYWFWLGTGATLTDGSTEDVSSNPALEDLLRVVEVRTL